MNHRLLLIEALKTSKARNPLFSLRAMARQLSVSPAHLSQLLSGKRPITARVALKIIEQFDLSTTEKNELLNSASRKNRRNTGLQKGADFYYLDSEEVQHLSDWYYLAILSLGKLKNNQASARWISRQLGIPFFEAKEAYEKLKLLGHIQEKNGHFFQSSKPLHSSRDIPSSEIRKHHKQNLDLAKDRIETVPIDLRDYSSMTMAVDPKKLAQAKKMIHTFKTKLSRLLESGEVDDVYTLAIQLFPITTKNRGEPYEN